MSTHDMLTSPEAAARAGVPASTWYVLRSHGATPAPDGQLGHLPWWHQATIDAWAATRPRPARLGSEPPGEVGDDDRLSSEQVARLAGLTINSFYSLRTRGTVPEPDGRSGRRAWWKGSTVTAWLATRQGRPQPPG